MNFIETLKSIGGVKPCPCTERRFDEEGKYTKMDDRIAMYVGPVLKEGEDPIASMQPCHLCHGTGTILDLAPLLAKPKELAPFVGLALVELFKAEGLTGFVGDKREIPIDKDYFVVGPQRAHSLVYEVARQLGGTAVTCFDHDAETKHNLNAWANCECTCPACKRDMLSFVASYRLSLPIPPDATCLFVTDRVDEKEMNAVVLTVAPEPCGFRFAGGTVLPYVLALIGGEKLIIEGHTDKATGFVPPSSLQVISLHQENP